MSPIRVECWYGDGAAQTARAEPNAFIVGYHKSWNDATTLIFDGPPVTASTVKYVRKWMSRPVERIVFIAFQLTPELAELMDELRHIPARG